MGRLTTGVANGARWGEGGRWVNRAGHPWEHPAHQPHVTVPELRSLCELLT